MTMLSCKVRWQHNRPASTLCRCPTVLQLLRLRLRQIVKRLGDASHKGLHKTAFRGNQSLPTCYRLADFRAATHLCHLLPVVLLGIELNHVSVHHLTDLACAVPVAPAHTIASQHIEPIRDRRKRGTRSISDWSTRLLIG